MINPYPGALEEKLYLLAFFFIECCNFTGFQVMCIGNEAVIMNAGKSSFDFRRGRFFNGKKYFSLLIINSLLFDMSRFPANHSFYFRIVMTKS